MSEGFSFLSGASPFNTSHWPRLPVFLIETTYVRWTSR